MRLFSFIRLFSLDIVAGALAALVFAATVMGVDLHHSYYLIMGITVWLIYTADHLMDGAKTHGKSESETSNFFYNYKIPIILVFLILLVLDFRLIVYRLDEKIVQFGMGPGIATILYLLMNRYYDGPQKWLFIKELWIAIIFTLAVWGGPIILAGDSLTLSQVLTLGSFGLIILSNVLIFTIYERDIDIRENNKSLVRDLGLKATVTIVLVSLTFSILSTLTAFLFFEASLINSLPLLLIASSMLLIISFPGFFLKGKLYGIITDLLLLLFFLVLIG